MSDIGNLAMINVRWRTTHGYAGLMNVINGIPTGNFLAELQSVIDDLMIYSGKRIASVGNDNYFSEVLKSDSYPISQETIDLYEKIEGILPRIQNGDRVLAKEAASIIEKQIFPSICA